MATDINVNWSRWIFITLAKHFTYYSDNIPFYIEGQIRSKEVYNFAELRMDGPFFNELNVRYWKIDITPAILIQIVQDDEDIYKLERYLGIFANAFKTDIPVLKYGDDNTQLGCLTLSPRIGERIRVDKFGQVQSATRIAQASIEAHYKMDIQL